MGRDTVEVEIDGSRRLFCKTAAALALSLAAGRASADSLAFLSLGTGPVNGVYYPVGRAICRLFNRDQSVTATRCSAESTPGSVYNLTKLQDGELDFAMVQSDTQYEAVAGKGAFAGNPQPWLRSVCSLHPELITIIARANGATDSFVGLKRKRLNTGVVGSGSRTTWRALEESIGWSVADRALLSDFKPDVALTALCADQLEATLLLVGHPSSVVRKHIESCDTHIVPLTGPAIEKLIAASPYFQAGIIPGAPYGLAADIPSFGVHATLVTTNSVSEPVVYAMTRVIIQNLDEVRHAHPALASLSPHQMMKDALTAPLHPGALRAYQEFGLIK